MTTIAEMLKRLAQSNDRSELNSKIRGFEVFNSRVRNNEMLNALDDLKNIAEISKLRRRRANAFR